MPSNGQKQQDPVIICPYLYDWEPAELQRKFYLDGQHGCKLHFFMWQDIARIGPELAFESCWNQFPHQDVILIHSDMSPMPEDTSNAWYDSLLAYRDALPHAGMIACNLFYPTKGADEPRRVQCAGGQFRDGGITHLHGRVLEAADEKQDGVPRALLEQTRPVKWVTFGGVLIRREVIQACGPFDRRYKWAYVMDVDYCLEARARGFQFFQVPVSLQHEESRTTRRVWEQEPELLKYMGANFEIFKKKWQQSIGSLND
jgi:hypothetical protein